jgi:hypothetical protein
VGPYAGQPDSAPPAPAPSAHSSEVAAALHRIASVLERIVETVLEQIAKDEAS